MSFILDALKKSQKERDANGALPEETPSANGEAAGPEEGADPGRKRQIVIAGIAAAVLVVLLGGGAAWYFLGGREPPPKVAAKADKPAENGEAGTAQVEEEKVAATPEDTRATTEPTRPEPAEAPNPLRPPTLVPVEAMIAAGADPVEQSAEEKAESEPEASIPEAKPETLPEPVEVKAMPVRKPPPPAIQEARLGNDPAAARESIEQAREQERQGKFDAAIEAYTRAIRHDPNAVGAYLGRAWSYLELGRADRAADDFTRAIRRTPDSPDGYLGRAWAYEKQNLLDRAAEDYGRILRIDPKATNAALSRGVIAFQSGRFASAAKDFSRVVAGDNPELKLYGLLWRYVSRRRAGSSGTEELALDASKMDLTRWPGVIVGHFLDRVPEDRVFEMANEASTADTRRNQICVTHFFLGELALATGDPKAAESHFRSAVDTGVTGYRQYWVAKAELNRLGATR